jgi:hypothetical protein
MNNLPLISHHLYVAAVAHEGRAQTSRTSQVTGGRNAVNPARIISLELLAQPEEKAAAARSLRTAQTARAVGGG